MFTRLLQAYLILVIVVLAIVSLVLAMKSGSLLVGVGIFVAGMIAVCLLGAFIEMINNIMDIREMMEKLISIEQGTNRKLDNINQTDQMHVNVQTSGTAKVSTSSGVGLDKAAASYKPSSWSCTNCGTRNNPESRFCKECGNPK